MIYPTRSKYCNAIRHPKIAFRKKDPKTKVESDLDPQLVTGKPVEIKNSQGIKDIWVASGGYASVFKYETFSPQKTWAVRCFTQSISNLSNHYKKVSNNLKFTPYLSYFLKFEFLDEGIRVDGKLYPIVKMEWAEGKDLKTFIKDNLNNKTHLDTLAQAWVDLSKDLYSSGVAHGDLQHGNVLVTSENSISLKLIDYDSLYFSSVDGNTTNDEIKGIPGYQHPSRDSLKKQCIQIDFFPQLVIYLSIVAIAEKPALWKDFDLDKTERLLFSDSDFQNPSQSRIFQILSQLSPRISKLSDKLKVVCSQKDFNNHPTLINLLGLTPTKPIDATSIFTGNQGQSFKSSSQTKISSQSTFTPVDATPIFTSGKTQSTKTSSPQGKTKAKSQPSKPTPVTWTVNQPSVQPKVTRTQTSSSLKASSSPARNTLVKLIATVSTVTAIALGYACYQLYQSNKQLKEQLERIQLRATADSKSVAEEIDSLKDKVANLTTERSKLQEQISSLTRNTTINFCNKVDGKTIAAAFAYWDGEGLRSRGWWIVESGQCKEVVVSKNYTGNIYTYGTYNRDERSWGSGNIYFCIDTINVFNISESDRVNCTGGSKKRVLMSKLNVSLGTNIWKFND